MENELPKPPPELSELTSPRMGPYPMNGKIFSLSSHHTAKILLKLEYKDYNNPAYSAFVVILDFRTK
jgi:hypothetical protein